jgi:toxin HigB-1
VSYRDKRTSEFAKGTRFNAFAGFERKAEMKIDQLDAATSLLDLNLPGNRLEALKGNRKGQYSIRINDKNGEFALSGLRDLRGRSMLRLWIIIEVHNGKKSYTSGRTSRRTD